MKALLLYLAQVLVTSGILYAWYHFALRNKKFHRYNRFYLLAATVISSTIPFLNIPVYFTQTETGSSFVLQTLTVISSAGSDDPVSAVVNPSHPINWLNWQNLSYTFYILIASLALLRIIISVIKVRRIAKNNPVEQLDNIHFVNTGEPGTPFSFFRWLFWNRKIELNSEKGEQIFRHELFHITQKHSWDIMYMELLTVVLWINPFFHLMKKEVKAIHEFLADRFAVTENTKWQYAELLLMQALNTNQRLVNPFFHNQIKRRIAMITTSQKPSYLYLRKLMVLPVAAFVIALFAFSYKEKNKLEDNLNKSSVPGHINSEDTIKRTLFNKIELIEDVPPPAKKSPSPEQLKSWTDSKKYGVWLDGRRISNSELTKYKSSDFGLYFLSKLEKNAVNYGNHFYQVSLMTQKYYEKSYQTTKLQGKKYIIIKDTTKPLLGNLYQKSLIVIDGVIREDLNTNNITDAVKANDIESITVLKGNSAFSKYKEKGGNGVIEITTIKTNSIKFQEVIVSDSNPAKNDNKIFDKVEIEPSFPGGETKWRQYLEKTLETSVPTKKKAPDGAYTVIIQFIVDKEGNISDVRALTNHGYGMENEALRVIKSGPRWNPAIQNGHQVKAYKRQLITFIVGKGQKNFPAVVMDGSSQNTNNKTPYYSIGEWDNSLLVIDGKVIGRLKENSGNAGLVNSVHITVLGSKPAMKKYGEQGKNGAWEAYTLKSNAEDYKNDTARGTGNIDRIFDKTEVPPSFPGGDPAWKRYLQKNANGLVPLDSGASAGVYKVVVQFIVHEDGSVSDVKALTGHGYGMENEAMRVIKAGPKWIPAKQNGHIVTAYVQQPITFAITDEVEDNPITVENKTSIFSTNDKKVLALDLSVLYIGVDNFITVAASEISKEDLVVTVSQGSITGGNGKYYIRVNAVSDAVILKVSSKDGKELGKQVFKVRTIPAYPAYR